MVVRSFWKQNGQWGASAQYCPFLIDTADVTERINCSIMATGELETRQETVLRDDNEVASTADRLVEQQARMPSSLVSQMENGERRRLLLAVIADGIKVIGSVTEQGIARILSLHLNGKVECRVSGRNAK